MAWIMDTYSMHKRHTVTAVVTGKPVEMGGSLGRREATGRGCMIVTREALAKLGMSLKGTRRRGAGLRQRGLCSADLMAKEGAVIVACRTNRPRSSIQGPGRAGPDQVGGRNTVSSPVTPRPKRSRTTRF